MHSFIKAKITDAFQRYKAFQADSKLGKVSAKAHRGDNDHYGWFTWFRHASIFGGIAKAAAFNKRYGTGSEHPLDIKQMHKALLSQYANDRHSFATY